MTNESNNRIKALRNAAKNKSIEAKNRINNALIEMNKNDIPITFHSVAKHARVSKTTLYANPDITNRIKDYRDKADILSRMLDQKSTINRKNSEILKLKTRIEYLMIEVKRLNEQLEIAYGELYKAD